MSDKSNGSDEIVCGLQHFYGVVKHEMLCFLPDGGVGERPGQGLGGDRGEVAGVGSGGDQTGGDKRKLKFCGCYLLAVSLVLVPPPSWPFFSGAATTSDMFLTNDWAWDDLGIIITAFAILTIVSISQVQRLLDDDNWTELATIMAPRLEFGTAGIRGRMGAGFGRMNDLVIIQV